MKSPWAIPNDARMFTPPYMDLHERGSYDTDELDALEAATRRKFPRIVAPAVPWVCRCKVRHPETITYCAACGSYAPWIGYAP